MDDESSPPGQETFSPRHVAPGWTISALGTGLLFLAVPYLVTTYFPHFFHADTLLHFALATLQSVFLLLPPLFLLYVGFHLVGEQLSRSAQWTIVKWSVTGAVIVVSVVGAVKFHQLVVGDAPTHDILLTELLTGAGAGGVLGTLVGRNTADAQMRADRLEDQRDAFTFLNRVLHHHVLNSVNIIDGYAARLTDDVSEGNRATVDTIRDRSEAIASVTQNVSQVLETFTKEPAQNPVDLPTLLRDELEEARLTYEDATFDSDIPSNVSVWSNKLLAIVFEELLTNAVEHSDADSPHVDVTVEEDDETVTIRVVDNGPGISAEERETLFQPSETGDKGLGLYLSHRIVTHHDGTIEVEDTGNGTAVTVELPKAEPR